MATSVRFRVGAEDEDPTDASAGARVCRAACVRLGETGGRASGCLSSLLPLAVGAGAGARFEAAAVESTAAVGSDACADASGVAVAAGVALARAPPVEFADAAGTGFGLSAPSPGHIVAISSLKNGTLTPRTCRIVIKTIVAIATNARHSSATAHAWWPRGALACASGTPIASGGGTADCDVSSAVFTALEN